MEQRGITTLFPIFEPLYVDFVEGLQNPGNLEQRMKRLANINGNGAIRFQVQVAYPHMNIHPQNHSLIDLGKLGLLLQLHDDQLDIEKDYDLCVRDKHVFGFNIALYVAEELHELHLVEHRTPTPKTHHRIRVLQEEIKKSIKSPYLSKVTQYGMGDEKTHQVLFR